MDYLLEMSKLQGKAGRRLLVGKPSRLAFPVLKCRASALKGLPIECVNSTHLTNSDLSPLQGESPYLMVPRVETLG